MHHDDDHQHIPASPVSGVHQTKRRKQGKEEERKQGFERSVRHVTRGFSTCSAPSDQYTTTSFTVLHPLEDRTSHI